MRLLARPGHSRDRRRAGARPSALPIGPRGFSFRYLAALLTVAAVAQVNVGALGLFGRDSPFLLYYPAVAVAAWLGGFGPGCFATALSAAAIYYFNMAPAYSFKPLDAADAMRVVVFLSSGVLMSWLSHASRRASSEVSDSREAAARSEDQLRTTIDALPALVAFVGSDLRYVFHNRAYRDWFGPRLLDVRGLHISEIQGEAAFRVARPYLERALAGERVEYEAYMPYRYGGSRWVRAAYTPRRDGDGRVIGLTSLVTDIAALKRTEERLDLAIRATRLGIWDYDPASGAVDWSDHTYELFSVPFGEPIDYDRVIGLIAPEDRDAVVAAIAEAFDPKRRAPLQVEFRTLAGRVLASRGIARFEGDRPARLTGTFLDVTESRRAEEEVGRANASLEQRVAERTEELRKSIDELERFTYTVAHDLRAPLRAVHRFSELLALDHPDLPQASRENITRVATAAKKMDRLIEDLLAYSRIGRSEPRLEALDARQIAKEVVASLLVQIQERSAKVTLAPGDWPRVDADRFLLTQVLTNLLANAIKFVPPGRRPEVELGARSLYGKVRLWVKDNGIGIEPRYKDRMFKLFERLHRAEDFPGTGIGLAIVSRAVERLGGSVGFDSVPGSGSEFWADLRSTQEP